MKVLFKEIKQGYVVSYDNICPIRNIEIDGVEYKCVTTNNLKIEDGAFIPQIGYCIGLDFEPCDEDTRYIDRTSVLYKIFTIIWEEHNRNLLPVLILERTKESK